MQCELTAHCHAGGGPPRLGGRISLQGEDQDDRGRFAIAGCAILPDTRLQE